LLDLIAGLFTVAPTDPTVPNLVADKVLPALVSTLPGAAAADSIAGAAPAAAASLFDPNIGRLLNAGPVKILQAVAEAAVPLYIGTSPAVADAVHEANLWLSANIPAPIQAVASSKPNTLVLYDVTVAGQEPMRVIASDFTGKVYNQAGQEVQIPAGSVVKPAAGTTVHHVPASGWDVKR
jgi:hypothetical protein